MNKTTDAAKSRTDFAIDGFIFIFYLCQVIIRFIPPRWHAAKSKKQLMPKPNEPLPLDTVRRHLLHQKIQAISIQYALKPDKGNIFESFHHKT